MPLQNPISEPRNSGAPVQLYPTPWKATRQYVDDANGRPVPVASAHSEDFTGPGGAGHDAACAHARLLAAGPDMLAALRLALPHIPERAMVYSNGTHGDRVYISEAVRAAISLAEGGR